MEGTSSITHRGMQNHAGYAFIEAIGALALAGWQALSRGIEAFAARQRQARARLELQNLSDHFLKDIGLERSQIDRLFR